MARNIEIKARLKDRENVESVLSAMGVERSEILKQHDTFYQSSHGRLKLRRIEAQKAELIYYEREDTDDPKPSHYLRTPIDDPDTLDQSLASAYGRRGVVKKVRHLYLIGRTRVHIDKVADLGDYLELEVVLSESETEMDGVHEANNLLSRLRISSTSLVAGAYIDLLESVEENRSREEQRS